MNSDKPRISVIIPAYNVEQYIEAALDSVFAQEVPAYEVIVVNDGSTDSTLEKINQYAHRPELQIISTENNGLGPARNEGFRHASGDYVYFFDSDDLMDQRLIKTVQSHVKKHDYPALILFSGDCLLDPGIPADAFEYYVRGFEMANVTGEKVLERMAELGAKEVPSACMYVANRRFWLDANIRFKAMFHEDVEMFPSLLLAAQRVVVTNDVLFHRRIRPMSITTVPKGAKYMRAYLTVALSGRDLYMASKRRPAIVRRYLKKRAEGYVSWYLKLCRDLREPMDCMTLLMLSCQLRSPKTTKRVIRFYRRRAVDGVRFLATRSAKKN